MNNEQLPGSGHSNLVGNGSSEVALTPEFLAAMEQLVALLAPVDIPCCPIDATPEYRRQWMIDNGYVTAQEERVLEEREIAVHICHRCKKQDDAGSPRVKFNFEFICNDCYRELIANQDKE